MNGITPPIYRLLISVAIAFLLAACGGDSGSGSSDVDSNSSSSSRAGGLILSITDAPVNDADIAEVWVRFTEVIVHPANGGDDIVHSVEDTTDPSNVLPYREIELKSLVGGKTMLLGEIPLDAGDYSWIRLVIDPDNTRIVETSGADYLMKCPSCEQSGFKLNRDFSIDTTGWIDFTIDFDLRQSLTLRRPNQPRADFDYILRPTLRILDTELASSFIYGMVEGQHGEIDPDACWVYVYEGDATVVVPDDICLDADTSICPTAERPFLTTPVQFDTGTGFYVYNTGPIYPATYTVALVCETDDPNIDDEPLFMEESGVQFDENADGARQDFTLVEIPILSLSKTLDENADEDVSTTVTVGDTLTYRMQLGNDGNVTLTNVTVNDPLVGLSVLTCDDVLPVVLAPNSTLDCTATYSVQLGDTNIDNTATADADQTDPVDSSVTVTVEEADDFGAGLDLFAQAQQIISFGQEFVGSMVNLQLTAQVSGTWNWDGGTFGDSSLFDDNWSLTVNGNPFGTFWYNADSTATEDQLSPTGDQLLAPVFTHGLSSDINSEVNYTDVIQVDNVAVNDEGNVVLDFTAATTQTSEIVAVEAVVTIDLPDTYIYEVDISAEITAPGETLTIQITGTNSGSLTSLSGNTIVTENPAGSGIWDISFAPADSVSDVLELRILEGTTFQLDLIATSTGGTGSSSTTVSSATWTDGTFIGTVIAEPPLAAIDVSFIRFEANDRSFTVGQTLGGDT
ncbi:MAG: hypothetical protein ACI9LO_001983 [Planctomycetota bacterium]|jgi:hypothetical protein